MTAREIATNLANNLVTRSWVPEGFDTPFVYLDGWTQPKDIGRHPTIVVAAKNSTGLWKSEPEHTVEVLLAINATAFTSNAAAQTTTPEGVIVFGAGALLEEVAERLVNTIRSVPGGLLTDMQLEYSLDTLPTQYVTLTLGYKEVPGYGDFCEPIGTTN